jgi:hypothetical protein
MDDAKTPMRLEYRNTKETHLAGYHARFPNGRREAGWLESEGVPRLDAEP